MPILLPSLVSLSLAGVAPPSTTGTSPPADAASTTSTPPISTPSAATPPADAPTVAAPTPAPASSHASPLAALPDDESIATPRDPLQGFNRLSYRISQPIDHYLLRPVAIIYADIVPRPLRDGLRNVLANLLEPVVFVNDLLQLRFKRALHTAARMALNTALGAGGLFDVAKRPYFNLPGHPNGFADTLGYYGIGPGPYLYIPILGPSSLRDSVGNIGDLFAQPRLLGKMLHPDNNKSIFRSSIHIGDAGVIAIIANGLGERARNDGVLRSLHAQSVDPYASMRSSYMQMRAGEIAALKAKDDTSAKLPELDDPLDDPAAVTPSKLTPSKP